MNVKDVTSPDSVSVPEEARIILSRQAALEDQYWRIEGRPAPTFSVNNSKGQVVIKDFLWRITEEIGEALEAMYNGEPEDKIHEELADALHFVAGLCIITNYEKTFQSCWENIALGVRLPITDESRNLHIANFVLKAGVLGNTLKMKPWKQTEVLTDEYYFGQCLYDMVCYFLWVCMSFGMSAHDLYDYYYRKSEVNLFRIRSNY